MLLELLLHFNNSFTFAEVKYSHFTLCLNRLRAFLRLFYYFSVIFILLTTFLLFVSFAFASICIFNTAKSRHRFLLSEQRNFLVCPLRSLLLSIWLILLSRLLEHWTFIFFITPFLFSILYFIISFWTMCPVILSFFVWSLQTFISRSIIEKVTTFWFPVHYFLKLSLTQPIVVRSKFSLAFFEYFFESEQSLVISVLRFSFC